MRPHLDVEAALTCTVSDSATEVLNERSDDDVKVKQKEFLLVDIPSRATIPPEMRRAHK